MPIITLEVMPDSSITESVPYDSFFPDTQQNNNDEDMKDPNSMNFHIDKDERSTGMHFLVDKSETTYNEQNSAQDANNSVNVRRDLEYTTRNDGTNNNVNVRRDLLEYTTRSDGSVCCKICGKILPSRTHWYRHKYRAHAIHAVNTAPLFQCEQCLVYFKSRKGYIGHIASKHSETLQDASPVLTNAQAEALAKEKSLTQQRPAQQDPTPQESKQSEPEQIKLPEQDSMEVEVKKEPDPELSIPKTIVPTFQNVAVSQTSTRSTETVQRRNTRNTRHHGLSRSLEVLEQTKVATEKDWKEKRSREEKLVADIIARVRRECEAQGSGGSTRRGYSRKSGLHA